MIGTINALLALLVFEALVIAFLVALVGFLAAGPEAIVELRRRTGARLRAAIEGRRP